MYDHNKKNESYMDSVYLPTPELSIRGNTAPPQQEEGEDITIHTDEQDHQQTEEEEDPEQQLQEQLLHEMQSDQDDMQSDQENDNSIIYVSVPQQEIATSRQGLGLLMPVESGH
jgi:hypothetical protein